MRSWVDARKQDETPRMRLLARSVRVFVVGMVASIACAAAVCAEFKIVPQEIEGLYFNPTPGRSTGIWVLLNEDGARRLADAVRGQAGKDFSVTFRGNEIERVPVIVEGKGRSFVLSSMKDTKPALELIAQIAGENSHIVICICDRDCGQPKVTHE